jgi:RNA polymerase sigma-70 factor, ECF subfamily
LKEFMVGLRIVSMKDENKVVRRILSGKTDEYGKFIDRYQTGLIIHCENIVRDRQDGEDIAQEAFIKAFDKLGEYDTKKGRFSTWLYKIASNLCIDHLRRKKPQVNVDEIEALAGVTMPAHIEDDDAQTIQKAIKNLEPPKFGTVIRAYYWEGKSYEDLAKEFDTSSNTIATWMRRAKEQLRKELSL